MTELDGTAATALAGAVAADHPRIMGAVIAAVGDWRIAEDAVQDACERALVVWEAEGVPANPAGWLVTTARRRGIDLIRRSGGQETTAERFGIAVERGMLDHDPEPPIEDDRLRLLLTCAHPALPMEGRVALTLRTVLGLAPEEIARLFFTSEAAMQKRLVRARGKIAEARIPYRVPESSELPARVDSALGVIYLLFTSGYADPERAALTAEAIRLSRLLCEILTDESAERRDAEGLLALLALHSARARARYDHTGTPLTMEEQDRTLWDRGAIAEAESVIVRITQSAAHRREPVGRYVLQAAIALEHARPVDPESTDWGRIAELHALLHKVAPSPAQSIAWAVAVGRAHGLDRGLALLDDVAVTDDLHLLHAARGDLLERADRLLEAETEYRRAAELTPAAVDRVSLLIRADRLRAS